MANGAEMTARRVRAWLETGGTEPLFIEPRSPWENGYCESFNGKLRDECLNGEIFYSLKEARVVIEMWRKFYNTERLHSALGYRPPAPVTWIAAAWLGADVKSPFACRSMSEARLRSQSRLKMNAVLAVLKTLRRRRREPRSLLSQTHVPRVILTVELVRNIGLVSLRHRNCFGQHLDERQ